MHIREKIDFKKYILFSLILFAVFIPFFHQKNEIFILLITYVAVLINQFMLIFAVNELVSSKSKGIKPKNGLILFLFLGKALILVIGLIFGVQMIQSRVIIAVIFYICQIFVLILSSNRRIISQ